MIGFLHKLKNNDSMSHSIDVLQARVGAMLFSQILPVILTDRGSEFEKYSMFEADSEGVPRLNIFYCDPMQSAQKPHVENNHNYIRDIIPNGYPMNMLTQSDIDLMFSHINSTPRRSLADKTPFDLFSFFYDIETAHLLGITRIAPDDVILKPGLIYSK